MLVERAAERVEVGDVAAHERQLRPLGLGQDEAQPVVGLAEVVADGLVPVVQHRLDRPGPDAAERAGHEHALAQ